MRARAWRYAFAHAGICVSEYAQALGEAHVELDALVARHGRKAVLEQSEAGLMTKLQAGFVNFYDPGAPAAAAVAGARAVM